MADELDHDRYSELIEESQDLHSDAMKQVAEPLDAIGRSAASGGRRGYAELVRERSVS